MELVHEGRSGENGTPYFICRDGSHIKGGINLSLSYIRYIDLPDLKVVNRTDFANALETIIVDLTQVLLGAEKGIAKGIIKTIIVFCKRVVRVLPDGHSPGIETFMKFDIKANYVDRSSAKDCLYFLGIKLCRILANGDKKELQMIVNKLSELFYQITTEEERRVYVQGQIL